MHHGRAPQHQGTWQAGAACPYGTETTVTTAQPVICSYRDGQKWPKTLFKNMQFFERPIQGLTLQSWFCATYPLEEVGFETFPVSVLSRYLSLGNISVSQCAAMGF